MPSVSQLTFLHRNLNWPSLIVWVASTIVGGLTFYLLAVEAILVLAIPISGPSSELNQTFIGLGAIGGAVAGLIVGLAQWLVLRRRVGWAGNWAKAAILGWAVGGAVCSFAIYLYYDSGYDRMQIMGHYANTGWLIAGIAAGLGLGLSQFLILHRNLALKWLVLMTLTWIVAWTVVFVWTSITLLTDDRILFSDAELLSFWLVVGTIYGIVTALAVSAQTSTGSE